MYDGVFTEQDNLARSADEPLAILLGACGTCLAKRKLFHSTADRVRYPHIVVGSECDCTRFDQGMTEIIQQVCGVFNTDTQSNQIFGQSASCASSGVNGSVPVNCASGFLPDERSSDTHDITQGILMRLFTQPKLTLIPQSRVAPTMRSLSSLSPVSNDRTAP